MITIGVDPGKAGAIGLVDDLGDLIGVHDMPLAGGIVSATLLAQLEEWTNPTLPVFGPAVIEDVHSMPKQGVASSFGFGRSKGVVEGVFAGAGRPLVYVAPSKWKKDLALSADKDGARRRAIELWPAKAQLFARVKDDGRAEAALIAYWHLCHGRKAEAA